MSENQTIKQQLTPAPPQESIFVLKGEVEQFDEERLLNHFKVSNEIRNVFYTSDSFSPKRPQNKIKKKHFINVGFKGTLFADLFFQDCIFEECLFTGVEFRNCEFHDCKFKQCIPYKLTFSNTYIDPSSFTKLPDPKRYANIGVDLFQELYRNSHHTLQPEFKDSAEYEFKKWKRYLLVSRWRRNKIAGLRFYKEWTLNQFFNLVSGYGLRPLRIIIWSIGLLIGVVSFNYKYWDSFGFHSSVLGVSKPTLPLVFYYSIVTLSTLGYGDVTPTSDFGLIMAAVEAMIGLLWLALVASVIIKRLIR